MGAIFATAGVLRSVFVQIHRKEGRRFRFGFIRYNSNAEAENAIRRFNGLKLEGAYLVVKKGKYPTIGVGHEVKEQQHFPRSNYIVQGKVWRPRRRTEAMMEKPPDDLVNTDTVYSMADEEKAWVERCACATMHNVQTIEVIHDGLRMQGLGNFKLKLLGARDVLLEFENREEMLITLSEASSVLDIFFEWYSACTKVTVGVSFLVWVRVLKVPLGAWNTNFFENIGNTLGKFVCVDGITSRKERLDFA